MIIAAVEGIKFMHRTQPELILDGVVFHNGKVVICWRTEAKHGYTSVGVYDTWEAFTFVHIDSHPTNGTEMQWLSPPPQDRQRT